MAQGLALFNLGRRALAAEQLTTAAGLEPDDVTLLLPLAAALAELGKFAEAAATAIRAAELVEASGDERLAAELRSRADQYRQATSGR